MSYLEKHIFQLENELLRSEIRKSAQKISELLCDDFIEFSSSGSEYHYKMGDTFQAQDDIRTLNWEIVDFKIEELSYDCILAIYEVIKHDVQDESKKYSLRSSIWRNYHGEWKMFFHQGTVMQKSKG